MPTLAEILQSFPEDDFNSLENLADSIQVRGLAETQELIRLVNAPDAVLARKALFVLLNVGPMGVVPQLGNVDNKQAGAYAQTLSRLSTWVQDLRLKQGHQLALALDDKRPLPPPKLVGKVEGRIREKRVCDHAYLLLRQLLLIDDSEEKQAHQEKLFLDLPENRRDLEITKFKQHRAFTQMEDLYPGE